MILTRTPLRISFVGGGSDRPSFFTEEPGACVAAAIDKYVYVAVNPKYDGSIRVAYSRTEDVQQRDDLEHELAREALRMMHVDHGIEVHSIADIPGGTGLGSSSAFTVGLMHALHARRGEHKPPAWLAAEACAIEIGACQKPIGKQDQYATAYGGINRMRFTAQGVDIEPIECDHNALSDHCLLLDTGMARQGDAGAVLAAQHQDRDDIRNLAQLAWEFGYWLEKGDLSHCGHLMDQAWLIKSKYCSTVGIDRLYRAAQRFGAWGGKLCGAGGGGFLLFLAPPEKHTTIISALGLRHVPIRVGVPGSEVVYR